MRWGVEWRGGVHECSSSTEAWELAVKQSPIGWVMVVDESGEWRRFGES